MKKQLLILFVFSTLVAMNLIGQNADDVRPRVKIETDFGDMIFELYNETPKHRDNFLTLAREGSYDGTIFHRVIAGFMMQGGDLASKNAKPDEALGYSCFDETVDAEINLKFIHKKGALAAARQADEYNPQRVSSGCQFYIVQGYKMTDAQIDAQMKQTGITYTEQQRAWYKIRGGSAILDGFYTIFGEIVEGLEVIDLICVMKRKSDRPIEDIKMKVTVLEDPSQPEPIKTGKKKKRK